MINNVIFKILHHVDKYLVATATQYVNNNTKVLRKKCKMKKSSPFYVLTNTAFIKHPIHSQINWAILLYDVMPDGKLSKLRSFDRQYRRPQNCPFQSSFTQRTAQLTQGISQFPQFTCRHHDGIISRHSTELTKKTDKPDRKPVLCRRIFSSVFVQFFFTQLNCTV
jgi:hypothetical protein